LAKLGRLHGHFFNWYDTKTLEPSCRNTSRRRQRQPRRTSDRSQTSLHRVSGQRLFRSRVIEGLTDTINASTRKRELSAASGNALTS
jgi:hypothetical protein